MSDLLVEGTLEEHRVCQSSDEGFLLAGGGPSWPITQVRIGVLAKSNDFGFVHPVDFREPLSVANLT